MNIDPRAVLHGLGTRSPFAPSIPASAGGWTVGALVAGFTLVVHLLGLAREVTDPATGHRIVEVLRDGVRSGAGGGIWCWLARLTEGAPIGGSSAWRIGLVSATASAAAAGLLAVWLRQRDVGRRAAVVGGLLFAFALPVWRSAVLPGPIPVAAAMSLLVLVLIEESRGARRESPRLLAWALAGVTALQGPEAAGMVCAVMAATALRPGSLPRRRSLGAGMFLVGGLLALLLGGTAAVVAPYVRHPGGWDPAAPGDAIAMVAATSGSIGIGAAIGLLLLWRRNTGDAGALTLLGIVPLVAALILGGRGTTAGDPPELIAAVPLTYAALAALAAGGIDAILQRFAATPSPRAHVLTAASAALPLALLVFGSSAADHSSSQYAAEWSSAVLKGLPDDAIIVAGPDPRGGLLEYVQLVGGERPDVLLADPAGAFDPSRSPLLEIDPKWETSGEKLAALAARTNRPIFAIAPFPIPAGRWTPWGLVWRLAALRDATAEESDEAWAPLSFTDLPDDPIGARDWIDGTLDVPPRDRTARRIAADYYQALARRDRALSETGPWAPILERLASLRGM